MRILNAYFYLPLERKEKKLLGVLLLHFDFPCSLLPMTKIQPSLNQAVEQCVLLAILLSRALDHYTFHFSILSCPQQRRSKATPRRVDDHDQLMPRSTFH